MRNRAVGLVLCIAFFGCSTPLEFIDSFKPTQFTEVDSSTAEADIFERLRAIREIRPGMPVKEATTLLSRAQFWCISDSEAKNGHYLNCYAFIPPNKRDFAVRLRLYYQDDYVTRYQAEFVATLCGPDTVLGDLKLDEDRVQGKSD
jgi:hypothetical protein